eukprot:15351323-Ditylum_brightwellii.AAC.2
MSANEWRRWGEKMKVITEDAFPYLDMQISGKNNNLQFVMYSKENQTIKLTSLRQENKNISILDLYPLHAEALREAKLLPTTTPVVGELY